MEDLIKLEYKKIADNKHSSSGKCNILNNIIQVKLSHPLLRNLNQDISIDIKAYFNALIEKAESASIGYDSIEVRKVNEILIELTLSERIFFIDYLIRQLQKSSFENEIKGFQKLKTSTILFSLLSKENFYKPKSWGLFFLYFPMYNMATLCFTFIMIGFFITIVLLPSPFSFMGVLSYELTYQHINADFFVNHLLNVFSSFVGIESDFKVVPKDTFSAVVYILGRILAFIYVVNYLFNKLSEYLKS